MKVKIVKASKPTYWYADKIGEVFEVEPKLQFDGTRYAVNQFWNDNRLISTEDCEVIE